MAVKSGVTAPTMSLGVAQANLEASTKELKAAQSLFERSTERLQLAEESHAVNMAALMAELQTVRGRAKVVPINLK